MSTQAIREYLHHVWKIYQRSSKKEKTLILDEICRNLRSHRKASIRLMNRPYPPRSLQGFQGGRHKKYSKEAKKHISRLWKQMGYMCPARMKAALPEWLPFDFQLQELQSVRQEILNMSSSSIQRFLQNDRHILRRKMNTGTRRGPKKYVTQVPIRAFEVLPQEPGHIEIDCVAHCGNSMAGEFTWTLTMTDVYTGWTECAALWGKTGANVKAALERDEERFPFDFKAIYSDNGSEFMNQEILEKYVKNHPKFIKIYRGRPYRKNDQCYVEQKNYTHVRLLFGYGRLDDPRASRMMNYIYQKDWRWLQNFYSPQQKLIEKKRVGSSIKRKMSEPKTPLQRLLEFDASLAEQLIKRKSQLDPFKIKRNLIAKMRDLYGTCSIDVDPSEWGKISI